MSGGKNTISKDLWTTVDTQNRSARVKCILSSGQSASDGQKDGQRGNKVAFSVYRNNHLEIGSHLGSDSEFTTKDLHWYLTLQLPRTW